MEGSSTQPITWQLLSTCQLWLFMLIKVVAIGTIIILLLVLPSFYVIGFCLSAQVPVSGHYSWSSSIFCLCLSPTQSFIVWIPQMHIACLDSTLMSLVPLQVLAYCHQIVPSCQGISSATEPSPDSLVSPGAPSHFSPSNLTCISRTCFSYEPSCTA